MNTTEYVIMIITFVLISFAILFSLYRCISSTCEEINSFRAAAFNSFTDNSKPSVRSRTDSYFRRRPSNILHDDSDLCNEVKVDICGSSFSSLRSTDKPIRQTNRRKRKLRKNVECRHNTSESFPESSESGIDNIGYNSVSSGEYNIGYNSASSGEYVVRNTMTESNA